MVEAYPQDTGGQQVPASVLYNGTRRLFEQASSAMTAPGEVCTS